MTDVRISGVGIHPFGRFEGSTGTVWLHTTVNVPPPGYAGPVPYGLGIVELDGTPLLRVVARLAGAGLERGTAVRLDGEEVPGTDGEPAMTWVFRS